MEYSGPSISIDSRSPAPTYDQDVVDLHASITVRHQGERIETTVGRVLLYEIVPDEIVRMVQERSDARDAKNWSLADELRAAIEAAGYVVEDTGTGSVARKAK